MSSISGLGNVEINEKVRFHYLTFCVFKRKTWRADALEMKSRRAGTGGG